MNVNSTFQIIFQKSFRVPQGVTTPQVLAEYLGNPRRFEISAGHKHLILGYRNVLPVARVIIADLGSVLGKN